jgi:hypothetical protein
MQHLLSYSAYFSHDLFGRPFLLVRVIRRVVRVRNLRLGVGDERGLSQARDPTQDAVPNLISRLSKFHLRNELSIPSVSLL